jgi:hypothetical protein
MAQFEHQYGPDARIIKMNIVLQVTRVNFMVSVSSIVLQAGLSSNELE